MRLAAHLNLSTLRPDARNLKQMFDPPPGNLKRQQQIKTESNSAFWIIEIVPRMPRQLECRRCRIEFNLFLKSPEWWTCWCSWHHTEDENRCWSCNGDLLGWWVRQAMAVFLLVSYYPNQKCWATIISKVFVCLCLFVCLFVTVCVFVCCWCFFFN